MQVPGLERIAAGVALVAALRLIGDLGSNLFAELLGGAHFIAFEHYAPGDVFDPATSAQYYFHAHAPDEYRQGGDGWDEISHTHTFVWPEGRCDNAPIHHLIAIATAVGPDREQDDRARIAEAFQTREKCHQNQRGQLRLLRSAVNLIVPPHRCRLITRSC